MLVFHAFLFPLYFKTELFRGERSADGVWGSVYACSVAASMFVAPAIGLVADQLGRRFVFSIVAILSFAASLLLSIYIGHSRIMVVGAFLIANSLYYLTSNLYDSLLVNVSSPMQRVNVSGRSWGFGYLGGVCCFVLVYGAYRHYGLNSVPPFVVGSAFYGLIGTVALSLMWPLLHSPRRTVVFGVIAMVKHIGRRRAMLLFGYWLIAEVIGTVVFFTAIYASHELHLTARSIGLLLVGVQVAAFPATWLVSRIASKIGINLVLCLCGVVWLAVLMLLSLRVSFGGLVVAAILTACVIGSTQSLMRAQFSLIVESGKASEMFGWYAIASESAAVIGPLLFGWISVGTGSERVAMASLSIPLSIGVLIVVRSTTDGVKCPIS